MKAIYAKDIKAMVKQFDLNEAESDYLNDTPKRQRRGTLLFGYGLYKQL